MRGKKGGFVGEKRNASCSDRKKSNRGKRGLAYQKEGSRPAPGERGK